MAKDNQTTTIEEPTAEQEIVQKNLEAKAAEEQISKEDKTATEKAVKNSKAFDDLLDKEGVEAIPSDDDEQPLEEIPETDDKDSGKQETTQTESKISDEMSKRALELGITKEEIESFESDAELEKTVKIIESVVAEEDEQPPVPAQHGKEKAEQEQSDSILKFENEDDIDPEILSNMKNMEKHYKGVIDKLSKQVESLQANTQQKSKAEFLSRFDKMIDGLGLEFAEMFGKGATSELGNRSQAFKNRNAVREMMYISAKNYNDLGKPIPSEEKLFNDAMHSLYGEKLETIKSSKVTQKANDYVKGRKVQRPSTKPAGNLTADQKALQHSKDFDAMIDLNED